MSDNYPDIAKLMAEANNIDIGWDEPQPETEETAKHTPEEEAETPPVEGASDMKGQASDAPETVKGEPIFTMPGEGLERYFEDFMEAVNTKHVPQERHRRVFCQLDRDVADSLDECDIYGRCRSEIVNAVLRQFIRTFLPRLAEYKRNRQSFFDNLKDD